MTERQTIKRPIKLGNERLFDDHSSLISGKRLGLITNQSGVDLNLRLTADRLHEWPDCELAALFSPEHGVRGDHQDGVEVGSSVDARTGVPVHSLYGSMRPYSPASTRCCSTSRTSASASIPTCTP